MSELRNALLLVGTVLVMLSSVDSRHLATDVNQAQDEASTTSSNTGELTLTFLLNGRMKTLKLKKNDNIPSAIPVYILDSGRVVEWNDPWEQEVSAYFNMETLDFLTTKKLTNGAVEFTGTFHDETQRYSIMPSRSNKDGLLDIDGRPLDGETEVSLVEVNGMMHCIVKQTQSAAAGNDDVLSQNEHILHKIRERSLTTSDNSNKQQFVVDYAAVIDYAIYNRWFSASQETTDILRRQDAQRNIMAYYAYVVHMIDMRYAAINEADFSIRVRFIACTIAVTPFDSPFTESSDIKLMWNGDAYSYVYRALNSFSSYVANNSQLYGTADHVGLFTGNYLNSADVSAAKPVSISGLAWISGVCSQSQRVSISHEFGQYSVIESGAHELGHNLGSQHDGDTGNTCTGTDQFIMASSPGQLTPASFNNPFRFSSCSINYFRQLLLNNPNSAKCLLENSKSSDIPFQANPGQTWNADQQCQQMLGTGSFYCAGNSNDQIMCSKMLCWDPITKKCSTATELRAFDGTTCGNRRWCQMGQCVSDPAAPPTSDTCVYGDYRGMLTINSVAMTCDQMRLSTPSACYDNNIASQCCKTCSSLFSRPQNTAGCEFGDRSPNYCSKSTNPADCYQPSFLSDCCATCQQRRVNKLVNSNDNCAYGDSVSGCAQNPSICYGKNSQVCCHTCAKLYTGITGCEYGDTADWCKSYNVSPDSCKNDASVRDNCCGSCAALSAVTTTTKTTTPPTTPTTTITKTTMVSTTKPTTTVSTTKSSSALIDKLGYGYCSTLNAGQWCYSTSYGCCRTCNNANTGIAGCEFGDSAPWCSSYVQGPNECARPEVAKQCCKTCAQYNKCTDSADWCSNIFPGQCYDDQTRSTCCATCSQKKQQIASPCCPYGDKYSWCKKEHCSTNASDCCATCAQN